MEVIQFIQANDTMNLWKTGPLIECFGTLLLPSTENTCNEGICNESNMLVCDLETLLDTHVKIGDSLAVTFFMHTICMHRKSDSEWYIFDSLSGEMVYLPEITQAKQMMSGFYKNINIDFSQHTYSGVICKKCQE